MTHGRTTKASVNPRSEKRSFRLTRISEKPGKSLESRVAKLEARVEQMEEGLNQALGGVPTHIREAIDSIGKKHRGPQKKIDDTELLLNRNNLVQWLEQHWPQITKPLLTARTPVEIAAVLTPVAAPPDIRPTWQRGVMGHPAELLAFLRSKRFSRKPPKKTVVDALDTLHSEKREHAANRLPTRQIANAMAGVPKLKWRTSLDKCGKNPCSNRVGHNTVAYLQTIFEIHKDEAH